MKEEALQALKMEKVYQRERTESSDSLSDKVKEHASKGAKLLVNTYLLSYNVLCLIGWSLILLILSI